MATKRDPAEGQMPLSLSESTSQGPELPSRISLPLAGEGHAPFDDDAYFFEPWWPGAHATLKREGHRLILATEHLADPLLAFPELAQLAERISADGLIIEGTLLALDADGRPDTRLLRRRLSGAAGDEVAEGAFVATDMPYLETQPLTRMPFVERRRRLAAVLHDLVRRLTGSATAALTAASMVLLYPPLVGFSHYLWPEILHLFLFVVVVWILVAHPHKLAWSLVAGLVTGLALLTKSLLGPFVPVLMLAAFARRPAARSALCAAAFLAAMIATVLPTVAEQHRRTGRWMVADSAAFNLWVGLNDRGRRNFEDDVVTGAYEDYAASSPRFQERNRILKEKSRRFFSEHGVAEVVAGQASRQYFRLLDKDSYLSDQLPGGVAVERFGVGYIRAPRALASATRSSSYLIYGLLLATAPVGLLVWRGWDRRWFRTLVLFLLYNLAIFFWLHVKSRYRIQLLPVLFMGSGVAVAFVLSEDHPKRLSKWQLVVGAAIAILVEFLAFAGPLLP